MELFSCRVTGFDGILLSQASAVGAELCLCVATLKNPDSLVYGCRKLWRSEERQLLSRHLIPPPPPPRLLFPLSQEPNTGPGHRDRAGECQESSQHICSLLCTFSPLWGCKERRRFQGKSPSSESGRTRLLWLMGKRRATGECVILHGSAVTGPAQQRSDHLFLSQLLPDEILPHPHPQKFDQRFLAGCHGE